jgi:uncharacterized protein
MRQVVGWDRAAPVGVPATVSIPAPPFHRYLTPSIFRANGARFKSQSAVAASMSPNKKVIETYMSARSNFPALLTDDAEWVEWADGVPASGVRTQGKAAFVQNLGNPKLETEIIRMMEEDNVVVAEGIVRVPKNDGGVIAVRICDIFELEHGKVKRLSSFAATLKESA